MNSVELPIDVSEVLFTAFFNALGMLLQIASEAPWWVVLLVLAAVFLHLVQPQKQRQSRGRSRRYGRHSTW